MLRKFAPSIVVKMRYLAAIAFLANAAWGPLPAMSAQSPMELLTQGKNLLQAKRYAEAERLLVAASQQIDQNMKLEISPQNTQTFDYKSMVDLRNEIYGALVDCYVGEKQMDKAAATEARLIDAKIDSAVSDDDIAMECNNCAAIYFQDGKPEKARAMLEKALSLGPQFYGPEYSDLHRNYKKVLQKLGANKELQSFESKVGILSGQTASNKAAPGAPGSQTDAASSIGDSAESADVHPFVNSETAASNDRTSKRSRHRHGRHAASDTREVTSRQGPSQAISSHVSAQESSNASQSQAATSDDSASVSDDSGEEVGKDGLDTVQARRYLLSLINRDRAKSKLPPVVLDATATAAGQFHSNDTASHGYNDHYDLQGRGPDWRYTLVGGTNAIAENNLAPWSDAQWKYSIPDNPRFSKKELQEAEKAFFDEKPPQDGHRKNILNPQHDRVGLGITRCYIVRPKYGGCNMLTLCEEFVDAYGAFQPLPLTAKRGSTVSLLGKLDPGVSLYCVEVQRDDMPGPVPIKNLRMNAYHSYGLPQEKITSYWPRDAKQLPDGSFQLDVTVDPTWKKGLYYFSVWVKKSDSDSAFITSRQIVAVEPEQPVLSLSPKQGK